jgi:riboflavin kinase/FMN adenylyltransferase
MSTSFENTKKAYAIGLFDGVHLGHKEVLHETVRLAEEKGFIPAAATFTCSTICTKNIQQRLLLMPNEKRNRIKAEGIEDITEFNFSEIRGMETYEFIQMMADHYNTGAITVGEDFRFGKGRMGDVDMLRRLCADYGILLSVTPELNIAGGKISSGRIRDLLEAGDVTAANELLGYAFYYRKTVVKGDQLGRKLGFPTINQMMNPEQIKVKFGVYLSETVIDGKTYKSVTNAGVKPTVDYTGMPLLETYIDDFSDEIYGQFIPVHLLKYIRPQQKFGSLEELTAQMEADKQLLYI